MSDFRKKIKNFTGCNHNGCERKLQEAILQILREDNEIFEFSPTHGEINQIGAFCKGYGLELGCNFKTPCCRKKQQNLFVDIALARHNGKGKIEKIVNLCEVKIIIPKNYPFKGRWYKYIYNKINTPSSFDCIQDLEKFGKIVTDSDEGQIVFDLIKMLAFCEKISGCSENYPEIYQIMAVKKVGNVSSFDKLKENIISFLNQWKEHVSSNKENLSIYKWVDFVTEKYGDQKFAIQCKKPTNLKCTISDLGDDKHGYIHILLNWQPESDPDFRF